MDETNRSESSPEVIVITRDEATSPHVDDLLVRQRNLRGEKAAAGRKRSWFYQNWFVFALAGALGAGVAWAMITPFFDDTIYFQGAIQSRSGDGSFLSALKEGDLSSLIDDTDSSWIKIRDQKIWIVAGARQVEKNGAIRPLVRSTLKIGQVVGVYVDKHRETMVARFVKLDPPPQSASEASMTLGGLFARNLAAGMFIFPLVAGMIGLVIGAADGLVCRLFRRALLGGLVGLVCGFFGGFLSSIVANLVYAPITHLALAQTGSSFVGLSTSGFALQLCGRGLAWALAGIAMGLGQGIALRSPRLFLYGLLGGVVGGLLGGLAFDPIDLLLLGGDKPSSQIARLVGFVIIGISVGAMIGFVELMARDGWLRMVQGPLVGKEFLLFKDRMNIGSSPAADLYLFNDPQVAPTHAVLRVVGDQCEIEAATPDRPLLVNNGTVRTATLRHGDQITIGRTVFIYEHRNG